MHVYYRNINHYRPCPLDLAIDALPMDGINHEWYYRALSLHLSCLQRTLGCSWMYPFRMTLLFHPSPPSPSPRTTLILLKLMWCSQSMMAAVMESITSLVTSPSSVRQTTLRRAYTSSTALVTTTVNHTLMSITSLMSMQVPGFITTQWMLLRSPSGTPRRFMPLTVERSVCWVRSHYFIPGLIVSSVVLLCSTCLWYFNATEWQ